ncbi:MAG: sugar transporter permease [Eubacterium sp.]|jgi:putative aldouronate transport system permease protein|nr:sugar transporter permease [Eubacterium sp.]
MATSDAVIQKERKVLKQPGVKGNLSKRILKHWQLYLLILPSLLSVIIFKYIPMYGVQIAFRNYQPAKGFMGSPWVGLKYFEDFFSSYQFSRLLINTLSISIYSLIALLPVPVILALSLNETRWRFFKKSVQTITYAPYFISTVVLVSIIFQFLSPYGLLNNLLGLFGIGKVDLMANPALFKSLYVWSGVWQQAGYYAVIYLAALAGINSELYEAAWIDGASTFQKIIHIDLPGIMPTIIIILILNTASILNVDYQKILLMQNQLNMEASDVISTYVYRQGLVSVQYSFSSAIGLFNSVISMILFYGVNFMARKYSETSLW